MRNQGEVLEIQDPLTDPAGPLLLRVITPCTSRFNTTRLYTFCPHSAIMCFARTS
jgi:hypothetical protein